MKYIRLINHEQKSVDDRAGCVSQAVYLSAAIALFEYPHWEKLHAYLR